MPDDTQRMLYRILSTEQQKHLEIKRQIDMSYSIPGLARFRVNVYFQRESLGAAFRMIPAELKTLEQLNLASRNHSRSYADKPRGLVLVTGPTGSGKTTTLAAVVDHINRTREGHIMTIEDPIEFLHRHKGCIVNQRQMGLHANSFADALRGALRRTPTSSSSARSATSRRSRARSPRPRPASSSSARCNELGENHRPHDRRFPAEQQNQIRINIV